MLKHLTLIILFISSIVQGQLYRIADMESAKRENGNYYVWIYFTDKDKSTKKVTISNKTIKRRAKLESQTNFSWYDTNPTNEYVEKVLATGAKLRRQSRWFNAISIECTEEQLSQISYMPFVKELKSVKQFKREKLSTNISNKSMSKLANITEVDYGNSKDQIEQINVHLAHEAGFMGQGVTVLMLDTGFNLEHAVFDSLNIIAEWDFINNDALTRNEDGQDVSAQHNHGTATFSALGGYVPGTLVGPAYKADFLLAKTEILNQEIQIEEDNYVAGLEWGESLGADVASSSLGYTDWYTWENMDGNTAITTKVVDIAVKLGVVCVTSAGNENGKGWNHVIAPADADSVISVGAVNSGGLIAGFSSRGPTFDGRIKPEVCARGVATYAAHGNGISYYGASGTSLSAPLVGGAVAVILSAHPDWTPMMVRAALMETASQATLPNNTYGWGIIDTWAAINWDPSTHVIPEEIKLYQNGPNPFNYTTTIKYDLDEKNSISLKIYDILGQEVITLIDNVESPGVKKVVWNGTDKDGNKVSSGVYFYRMQIDDKNYSKKMMFIK